MTMSRNMQVALVIGQATSSTATAATLEAARPPVPIRSGASDVAGPASSIPLPTRHAEATQVVVPPQAARQLEAEIERLLDQLEAMGDDDPSRAALEEQLEGAMRAELSRMDEAFESTFLLDADTVEQQRRKAEEFLRDS
ncbi:MAG: hypothetical protein CMN29_04605 [Sandaracinus sp.]|nr:hypothetical protein [Myxococcales bacterium]MAT24240.1 hypothetical protein [Sandaracinus sp.]